MIAYGIIFLVTALSLLVISLLLFFGQINLLHDYHRNNVKPEDKKKLGRASGISLLIAALGAISSGISAFFWTEDMKFIFLFLIFIIPFIVSVTLMFIFIKKYNGKIISWSVMKTFSLTDDWNHIELMIDGLSKIRTNYHGL